MYCSLPKFKKKKKNWFTAVGSQPFLAYLFTHGTFNFINLKTSSQ